MLVHGLYKTFFKIGPVDKIGMILTFFLNKCNIFLWTVWSKKEFRLITTLIYLAVGPNRHTLD